MKISLMRSGLTFLIFAFIFTVSCSTFPTKTGDLKIPRQEIEKKTPHDVSVKDINEKEILRKIHRFQEALKKRASNLTKVDHSLHDELLAKYIQLKNQLIQNSIIRVPARSRLKITLPSFCLDSDRASPVEGETFEWVKNDPDIPYYKELLNLSSMRKIKWADAQTILWNLQNNTRWESYPENLKAILQRIDPKVSVKLPSNIKDAVKDSVIDYLNNQVSLANKIGEAVSFIDGEYYKYDDFARSIEQLTSKYPLVRTDALTPIADTGLYSDIQSEEYNEQNIVFYNPTAEPKEIDLSDYYLQPHRKDVQRIGVAGKSEQVDSDLLSSLEEVLYGSMARLGVGFTPVLGDAADIYQLLAGKDFLNGEKLTLSERLLSGIGIIAGSGAGYRYASRAAYAPEKFIPEFEKGFEQVAKKEISLAVNELKDARKLIEQTKITEHAVLASPTLRKTFQSPNFKKTDFYVRPNGEVIPAKGYKYVSSQSSEAQMVQEAGILSSRDLSKPHYVTFDRLQTSEAALDRLQLPRKSDGTHLNDARYRIEFDTRQTLDDLSIPRGSWGTSGYLEPLTRDFPQFGEGGATQAIFSGEIKTDRMIDLKTGKTVFQRERRR